LLQVGHVAGDPDQSDDASLLVPVGRFDYMKNARRAVDGHNFLEFPLDCAGTHFTISGHTAISNLRGEHFGIGLSDDVLGGLTKSLRKGRIGESIVTVSILHENCVGRRFNDGSHQGFLLLESLFCPFAIVDVLDHGDQIVLIGRAAMDQRDGQIDPRPGVIASTIPLLHREGMPAIPAQFVEVGQVRLEVLRVREILKRSLEHGFRGVAQQFAEVRIDSKKSSVEVQLGDPDPCMLIEGSPSSLALSNLCLDEAALGDIAYKTANCRLGRVAPWNQGQDPRKIPQGLMQMNGVINRRSLAGRHDLPDRFDIVGTCFFSKQIGEVSADEVLFGHQQLVVAAGPDIEILSVVVELKGEIVQRIQK